MKSPSVRQRHADAGAPEGFTDAIGWMQVMTTDQFADAVLPHWSVTFSVGDTDAVAQQAVKLGGKVTVPPFEVSYTRVAVISEIAGPVGGRVTPPPPGHRWA